VTGYVVFIGETRNAKGISFRQSEEKISLRRPRRRWKDNIKVDFKYIESEGVEWINFIHDRALNSDLSNTVMKLRITEVLDFVHLPVF
jgi:hypothetical protein